MSTRTLHRLYAAICRENSKQTCLDKNCNECGHCERTRNDKSNEIVLSVVCNKQQYAGTQMIGEILLVHAEGRFELDVMMYRIDLLPLSMLQESLCPFVSDKYCMTALGAARNSSIFYCWHDMSTLFALVENLQTKLKVCILNWVRIKLVAGSK